MIKNIEEIIEKIAETVKANGDVSFWQKNRQLSPLVNLISSLNSLPKTNVPQFDFSRVRNQIINRITERKKTTASIWLPKSFRMGLGVLGSLMIVMSLTLATAVASLQSVPGQTIYPLKKVVENIQLKFASQDQRAALQLKFADNRADEIQLVLEKQQDGRLSDQETQKIVSATVQDLQKTTAAAATSNAKQPNAAIVNKLSNLTNKLRAASISTDGQTKIEIEKAVESTKISQEEAIQNIERAGIKIEDKLIDLDNSVTASGKLTAVTETSVSLGTAKFLLTKDTQYVKLAAADLKIDQVVDIEGEIKDNKAYALKITLISETPTATDKQ